MKNNCAIVILLEYINNFILARFFLQCFTEWAWQCHLLVNRISGNSRTMQKYRRALFCSSYFVFFLIEVFVLALPKLMSVSQKQRMNDEGNAAKYKRIWTATFDCLPANVGNADSPLQRTSMNSNGWKYWMWPVHFNLFFRVKAWSFIIHEKFFQTVFMFVFNIIVIDRRFGRTFYFACVTYASTNIRALNHKIVIEQWRLRVIHTVSME